MKVLFICVANSARSQMAEALARNIWGPSVEVASAGSAPAKAINPHAIEALREIGVDTASQRPKGLGELAPGFLETVDWVIPLCAEEQCPALTGRFKILSWSLPDPKDLEEFRVARDKIREKIKSFQWGED